jgi:flavorubredoxin
MKINILYESKFGNGKKMLDELSQLLIDKKQEVELFKFTETDPGEIPQADLYLFHTPTRQFMLPLGVRSFVKRFTPPAEKAKYALSTTYMDPRTIALKKIDAYLQKKGMIKATEDLKIKVLEIKGPLEEYGDKIEDFAERLSK